MNPDRLDYLDSVRGISAFVVLLYHCWMASYEALNGGLSAAFSSAPNLAHYVVEKLMAGRSAVVIFFVLSGFVLAYSLKLQPLSFGRFAIKRFFRIYPAFVCVLLASYLLHSIVGIRSDLGTRFLTDAIINVDLSTMALLKGLVFLGTEDTMKLDTVMWSLVHEMRISLLFPFILWSVLRQKWRAVGFYGLFSIFCTTLSFFLSGKMSNGVEESTVVASLLATGFFVVFFAVGALLCIEKERLASKVAALDPWQKALLLLVTGACLVKSGTAVPSDYIHGLGAVGLIVLALGSIRFQQLLVHRILTWSGRISYGIYLVHLPVIYVVTQYSDVRGLALAPIVMIVSLPFAEALNRFIEIPSNEFGRRLVSRPVTALELAPAS
jgi:peptidoglycan/LPS O-acetylase OafA/YrhL